MATASNTNISNSGSDNAKRKSETVCVTGGSGFIASWLVKVLLQRGYTVRATVRDPGSSTKVAHLLDLPGASERLTLYKANLLDEASFDAPIDGCDGVFHTASPFFLGPKNPEADFYDPAIKGTVNVLKACVKVKTVKRVVLTSSIVAVPYTPLRKPDDVVDESFFSDPDYLKEVKNYYAVSKTLAEKAAWEIAKDSGLDLVTINPTMVVGPLLQPTINTSNSLILQLLTGEAKAYSNIAFGWVDVRDVVSAHILAYETPTASGRYILTERNVHYSEICDILKHLCPACPIPTKCADETSPRAQPLKLSTEKAQKLGVNFTPLPESLKATLDCFKSRGLLKC